MNSCNKHLPLKVDYDEDDQCPICLLEAGCCLSQQDVDAVGTKFKQLQAENKRLNEKPDYPHKEIEHLGKIKTAAKKLID